MDIEGIMHIFFKQWIFNFRKIFFFSFDFDVHSSDLRNYKLQILVKDATNYGVFAKAPIIGMVKYRIFFKL